MKVLDNYSLKDTQLGTFVQANNLLKTDAHQFSVHILSVILVLKIHQVHLQIINGRAPKQLLETHHDSNGSTTMRGASETPWGMTDRNVGKARSGCCA